MKIIGKDSFFIERQLWLERLQSKPGDQIADVILLVILGMVLTACLMAAVPDYQGEDFTDSGVGCIDCLEPAEPMPVEP